ncbi:MAG TPA: ATP-binding protein [Burkholderiales bacterium]
MRLWPRTLFGRNVLLMAGLILFAEIGMALMFSRAVQEPRVNRLIEYAHAHTHAIRVALDVMTPEQRARYLAALHEHDSTHVVVGAAPAAANATPRPIARRLLARLAARMGPGYRLAWEEAPARRLWIGTLVGAQEYWFGVDTNPFIGNVGPLFLRFALGAGVLALIGAYLIQCRINQPLRALAQAASSVAHGRTEMPDLSKAPTEIAQVAASFSQMAADLEANERERALMLAGVSHDLRTPLAKLRLATEILKDDADAGLIESMTRNIAVADSVIDQFIAYARLGHDEAMQVCDLNEMARDVARTAGAPLRLELAPLPAIDCRPVALRRALANLVENALRYDGSSDPGTVELHSEVRGGRLLLSVQDRGPGIPAADLERMRRPFTRLEAARGGKPGAGLGLAIVERIVRLHRGELILRNREGGGLEATISLPAEPAAGTEA